MHYSSKIAQWWSIRLLTEGLGVRVPLFELINFPVLRGFLLYFQSKLIDALDISNPISISELSSNIQEILEASFPYIYVTGEISNFKHHISSGHFYFVLKDNQAQISAMMWKTRNKYLNFKPEDGMKVNVKGKITLYPPMGRYQIDVTDMSVLGTGELLAALEKLKEKLSKEGLFEEKYKIPIEQFPRFPEKVGIITSETGAVINDFRKIASKRFPLSKIILFPVNVQGVDAAEEIINAIKFANNPNLGLQILVIARGGGSIEDLWTFNEEKLARSVFDSKLPVVSAIGHEVDYTICDFVADVRASTPSNAAEIIFPDLDEIIKKLDDFYYDFSALLNNKIEAMENTLDYISNNFHFNKPLNILNNYKIKLDEYERNILNMKNDKLYRLNINLDNLEKLIDSFGPEQTLKRGYSFVLKDGKLVKSKKSLMKDDEIDINFYDGSVNAEIK